MNYIDIAIVGLVIFGAVKGFSKGFIIEAASLIALILGLIGALLFSSTVGTLLESFIDADHPSFWSFVHTDLYRDHHWN